MPPHQVIDTVDLYFLKNRQRRLSLRFLTWFVLDEHIQQDTHDSIEDARCALKLYNAFQSFEEQGVFDQKLDELYKEGRQYVRSHYHVTSPSLLTLIMTIEFQASSDTGSTCHSSAWTYTLASTTTITVLQPPWTYLWPTVRSDLHCCSLDDRIPLATPPHES